jgi:hypothetical protein
MREHRLRIFENRVLGKIFGPRKDEVREKWCRIHNEDLCDQYFSSNISQIKKTEMHRLCGRYGRDNMGIQSYRRKHERKKPFGRPRPRWKNNVKMDFKEVGWEALTGLIWLKAWAGG